MASIVSSRTDTLQNFQNIQVTVDTWDDGTRTIRTSPPAGGGGATAANQTTGNTSLASIDTKTPTFSATTVMQAAAVATGNGTVMDVSSMTALGIQIVGITSATITFEATIDGTNWVAVPFTNTNTGIAGTTATADGIYRARTAGWAQVRARISTWVSGTITATGHAIAASEAGQTPVTASANNVLTATLQNAAGATGNGTAMDVSGMSTLVLGTTISATATVTYEYSLDSTNGTDGTWASLQGETLAGGLASTATATTTIRYVVVGLKMVRARISAWTSGTVTVIGRAQANEGPLPQTNVALYPSGSSTVNIIGGIDADGRDASTSRYHFGADMMASNGSTLDRFRNNIDLTILASAARTTTTNSADQTNYNGQAIRIDIDITAVAGSPSLVFTVQVKDSLSGVYTTVLTSAALTGTGHTILQIGRGLTAVANLVANCVPGRVWRVVCTAGTADSVTYSVGASISN